MAYYVYVTTTDNRRVTIGSFTTREAAEVAAGAVAQGNIGNIAKIEISADVLPGSNA